MPKLQCEYVRCCSCRRSEPLVDGEVPNTWERLPHPKIARGVQFRCPQCTIGHTEKAFVRGYVIAVAATLRHQVNAEDLLRSIDATEQLLQDADVDEFDLELLRPILRKIAPHSLT